MSDPRTPGARRRNAIGTVAFLAAATVVPFYVEAFWLQIGLFAMAAAVGALGLNLLVGQAGQLSLAHSFFVAIGAYGYTVLASASQRIGVSDQIGLGLPPVAAAAGAVALAGIAGLLFSPVAARLRGIYLGVASIGLVFLGQHVLFNAEPLTGGFNGRDVPAFELFGFTFDDLPGETLYVAGVPFGRLEKLWYVALVVAAAAYVFYRGIATSRAGRALRAVRDGEVPATAMGVRVGRAKSWAFLASSMYAGLAGVLLALAFRRIVPETFGLVMAVEFLAMIVIGGLGSAGGAVAGAVFVSSLPIVLQRYSASLPFLAPTGSGGVTAGIAARFLYGAAIIIVLLVEPGGLAAVGRRLRRSVAGIARTRAAPPQRPVTATASLATTAPQSTQS